MIGNSHKPTMMTMRPIISYAKVGYNIVHSKMMHVKRKQV